MVTMPGGNPVIAVPGLTPRSPLIWLAPVLVTAEPANTAKLAAVPRSTGACAALALGAPAKTMANDTASTPRTAKGAANAPRRRRAPPQRGHAK
ncbi:hypothetical protein [Actinocrinis puniceicyclus]|uniref:hypothetical protein n=1 Tax=Actinocrinis puniceicyclus TaxID=977794 RepID=UPI001FE7096C|nr:hypothetical protein [Actinocrinis puniceicyclus]